MTLTPEEIFEKSGTVLKGHFNLASGLHSSVYWEKFRVLQYPEYTRALCRLIADHYRIEKIEVVAGPTTGGVILAYETARQLGVRGIFAEKEPGSELRSFRRDFEIGSGERVLIVDDILTTGKSISEVLAAVASTGGKVVGIGVMVDRSETPIDFGVPFFSCLKVQAEAYRPDACPLCAQGVPLVHRGTSTPQSPK
ncbi:MAG: orotate phosphoribosyltransferase [Dehalococcoidia bacterium]|jgi:orotate phosphoribosyltransferase|nr:MAG: orotate phosphoribosyltransferase [Dehalococcoidia bacterium]